MSKGVILVGPVDVLVCDGFVGNIILKAVEGTGTGMFTLLREELTSNWRSKMGGAFFYFYLL